MGEGRKRSPIGSKGAFRKISKSVSQKWISRNSTKWDPLGRHRVEFLILMGGRGVVHYNPQFPAPSLPLNPLLVWTVVGSVTFGFIFHQAVRANEIAPELILNKTPTKQWRKNDKINLSILDCEISCQEIKSKIRNSD